MNFISRREMMQVMGAEAVAVPISSTCSGAPEVALLALPNGVLPIDSDNVDERFVSLPFESPKLGGLFEDQMKINSDGRLVHVDEKVFLAGFFGRESGADKEGEWLGEHIRSSITTA